MEGSGEPCGKTVEECLAARGLLAIRQAELERLNEMAQTPADLVEDEGELFLADVRRRLVEGTLP